MSRDRRWLRFLRQKQDPTLPRANDLAHVPDQAAAPATSAPSKLESLSPSGQKPVQLWRPGAVILDLYEVRDVYEDGAMGLVYRAHHLVWDIDLAIKSPRPELFLTTSQRALFAHEAEIWTTLGLHPYLVCCYYVRLIEGVPHIFAEYVGGGTLAQWIDSKKLYEGGDQRVAHRVLDVAIQIAFGLHHAHCHGVIHRDLKPNNVMMTPQGQAKISDFGIAKAIADRSMLGTAIQSPRMSSGGMTKAYRSPEQAAGSPLSFKTDMWSWAVSILEMLCGEVVWDDGQVADDVFRLLSDGRLAARGAPRMPRELWRWLDHCLRRSPENRPKDMLEVTRGLVDAYERTTRQIYSRSDLRKAITGSAPTDASLTAGADISNRALGLLDLGHQEAALKLLRKWLAEHPLDAVPWCNEALIQVGLRQATPMEVARKFAQEIAPTHPRWEELGADAHRFHGFVNGHYSTRWDGQIAGLHWASDGMSLTSSSHDGVIRSTKFNGGRLGPSHKIHAVGPGVTGTWPTDDGLLFVGFDDGRLELRRIVDGALVSSVVLKPKYRPPSVLLAGTTRPISNAVRGVARVARGPTVIVYLENADIFELGFPGLELKYEWHESRDFTCAVSSPLDGRFVLVGELQGVLHLYDEGREEKRHSVYNRHAVKSYDLRTRTETGKTSIEMVELSSATCSPDGAWLASGSRSGGLLLWKTDLFLKGQSDRNVSPNHEFFFEGPLGPLAFATDNSKLFFSDAANVVRVIDLSVMECAEVARVSTDIVAISPTPDVKHLAIGTKEGSILLQPLAAPQWNELPFLICKPKSSDEEILRRAEIQSLAARSRSALETGQYRECAELAERGIQLAADDKDAGSVFRESLLKLPARRTAVRDVEFIWSMSPVGASNGQRGTRVCPFVNSVALAPDGEFAMAGDSGVHWYKLMDRSVVRSTDTPQVRSVCYAQALKQWFVCTIFGAIGRFSSSGDAEFFEVPGSPPLNSVVSLRRSSWAIAACGCGDGRLGFWDGHQRFETLRAMAQSLETLAVSPDCSWLALGGLDGVIGCLDFERRRVLTALRGHDDTIRSITFHPEGRWLASASDDGTVRIWDVTKNDPPRLLAGHQSRVQALAFTPDGDWIASGDADGNMILWNTASGESQTRIRTPQGEIAALVFDHSGGSLLSAHRRGAVCRWDLTWELDVSRNGLDQRAEQERRQNAARVSSPRPH